MLSHLRRLGMRTSTGNGRCLGDLRWEGSSSVNLNVQPFSTCSILYYTTLLLYFTKISYTIQYCTILCYNTTEPLHGFFEFLVFVSNISNCQVSRIACLRSSHTQVRTSAMYVGVRIKSKAFRQGSFLYHWPKAPF